MTGSRSIAPTELLALVKANPGISYHDLKRDFGAAAVVKAGALVKLKKLERRGRRFFFAY